MNDSRILSTAIAAALLSCSFARASAADSAGDLADEVRFESIIVTAVQQESPLTFETDPKQPRQPVPASDGADYLKTIPGFTAIRNGGTNGDPVLRGMFGSRLNLLTNDGTLLGACPARMDNPLSYVAPETYDTLSVVKGPQTVLWGPGASAGTVRFDRHTQRFTEPGLRLDGSLLFGSWGRNDQILDAAGGNANGYMRVAANRSEQDDYDDGDGDRVPSAWKKWNTDVEAGWTPDDDTRLVASLGRGNGEARYAGRGMDGAQFLRESAAVSFEKTRIGGVLDGIEANLFTNYADHVMDNYTLRTPDPTGPMPMPMASNVDRRTHGGRIAATWRWPTLELVTGIDHQANRHRERNAMGIDAYRLLPWVPDARFSNTGAFAELTWKAASRGRVIAGARVDRASAEDQRETVGMGMMPMPNPTSGEERKSTLSSAFARYEHHAADSPTTLYIGLGRSERFPDYWELFSPDMAEMGSVNAFSAIRPEKTLQLDTGAQYSGERLRAWVSLYAGRIDDYILFRYLPGGMMGTTSMASNVDARTRGGEAGANWRFAPSWSIESSVAYAWGENRSDGRALPQMPPLEARVALAYEQSAWSFGASWRAVARQSRVSIDEGNVVGRDLGPSPGFAVFAINAGYRIDAKAMITAGIDNLLDRNYAEHLNLAGNAAFGYPADPVRINEPGRTFWAKLNLSY